MKFRKCNIMVCVYQFLTFCTWTSIRILTILKFYWWLIKILLVKNLYTPFLFTYQKYKDLDGFLSFLNSNAFYYPISLKGCSLITVKYSKIEGCTHVIRYVMVLDWILLVQGHTWTLHCFSNSVDSVWSLMVYGVNKNNEE